MSEPSDIIVDSPKGHIMRLEERVEELAAQMKADREYVQTYFDVRCKHLQARIEFIEEQISTLENRLHDLVIQVDEGGKT